MAGTSNAEKPAASPKPDWAMSKREAERARRDPAGLSRKPLLTLGRYGQSMRPLIFLLLLAACSAQPTPAMFGVTWTDVVRDGRHYVIHQRGNQVEIIRLGYAKLGEHQAIRATMIGLITEVTGCLLAERTLQGDSGEMRGRVFCKG